MRSAIATVFTSRCPTKATAVPKIATTKSGHFSNARCRSSSNVRRRFSGQTSSSRKTNGNVMYICIAISDRAMAIVAPTIRRGARAYSQSASMAKSVDSVSLRCEAQATASTCIG